MVRWSGNRPFRKAFTLIETLVALGVLVLVTWLWRPPLRTLVTEATQDQRLLEALQAAQALQMFVQGQTLTVAADGQRVWLDKPNAKQQMTRYTIESASSNTVISQLRIRASGGQMPLLLRVKHIVFVELRPNVVAFTWTLNAGPPVEGVLYGATR
ncbi:hypothetical protein [Lacticaseibacillus absianus]|uniref:hypothetical protein n=1 Tax=Lacticaseibacillus absianus TaxID=2729623 RepID=UPI0015CB86D1|nr:hypothetical protein [Lacticaseibacillus absianus]